ncbi:A disintegrin and metalloproteinase with thrombospondin motifs 18, partial [Elysia marginata]
MVGMLVVVVVVVVVVEVVVLVAVVVVVVVIVLVVVEVVEEVVVVVVVVIVVVVVVAAAVVVVVVVVVAAAAAAAEAVPNTSAAASFTEEYRVSGSPWDTVDALSALSSFSDFAVGTGADFLNPYDHSMLFTGYDLSSVTETGITLTTTGLAYTSTLCRTDGKSVSVVEDHGGFQSIDTASHELGHSLSAKHDGEENLCRSTDRYIMAGGTFPQTDANLLNPWQFSVCSANYFTTFITDEIRSTRGQYCLNFPLAVSASIPDVSDRLPGQEVSPDQQCAQIYGDSSRLCRGREFGDDICTAMFCFDPATVGTCYEQTAARGTTCGDGKLCIDGECVADPRAPAVD